MGKRKKSTRKPGSKKQTRVPLDTVFTCLFCNHEKSVICKMDKDQNVGNLSCKVCGQTHQCVINYLSAPIDVYSDWIDACEDVQKSYNGRAQRKSRGHAHHDEEDDQDEDLPEPSMGRSRADNYDDDED